MRTLRECLVRSKSTLFSRSNVYRRITRRSAVLGHYFCCPHRLDKERKGSWRSMHASVSTRREPWATGEQSGRTKWHNESFSRLRTTFWNRSHDDPYTCMRWPVERGSTNGDLPDVSPAAARLWIVADGIGGDRDAIWIWLIVWDRHRRAWL